MQVMVETVKPCTHILKKLGDPHSETQELFQCFAREFGIGDKLAT